MKKRKHIPGEHSHAHIIDRLAVLNGVVSGIALYPQVFQVVMSGDTHGISLISFVIIFLNNIIWTIYAFHRGLISLLIAAFLNMIAAGILLSVFF